MVPGMDRNGATGAAGETRASAPRRWGLPAAWQMGSPALWVATGLTLVYLLVALVPADDAVAREPGTRVGSAAGQKPETVPLADELGRRFTSEPQLTVFDHGTGQVQAMSLEQYLAHVVAGEVLPTWHPDALRAQAVAARTYTVGLLLEENSTPRQLHGTDTSTRPEEAQAFGTAVPPAVREAVADTRGEILVYEGRPIVALFSSCAAERTAHLREAFPDDARRAPYLRPVVSRCDDVAPGHIRRWSTALNAGELAAVAGVPPAAVDRVSIAQRGPSGRASWIQIGPRRVHAAVLRQRVGPNRLRSTWLTAIQPLEGGVWVFRGRGWGHGVGLDQWGAEAMARTGHGYREILAHYYPGTHLVQLYR